jgi:hypothetical protein
MHKVGMRKDKRFDSDGQIKACRGRYTNEVRKEIDTQLEEATQKDLISVKTPQQKDLVS